MKLPCIQKTMLTVLTIVMLSTTSLIITRREQTLQKLEFENRTPFKAQLVRQKVALYQRIFGNSGVRLTTIDEGPRGNFDPVYVAPGNNEKGTYATLATNIDDPNEEDIREYMVLIEDSTTKEWVEVGHVLYGISCNMSVIGAIPANQYGDLNAVSRFDDFSGSPCNDAIYDRIEGNILRHAQTLGTSWGYYWLPKKSTVQFADGSTVNLGLYAGVSNNYDRGGFLITLESIEKPKAGNSCIKENRPGTLGDDGKCHWISCQTPEGLPGFKEADGDCVSIGCELKPGIPGVVGTDETTCVAAAGLTCRTNTVPEGTTDASGNCTAKPGQDCVVPNSHGSKGITVAGGKCIGIAGGACMNADGTGGKWSNDGKTCNITTGTACVTGDGKDGIMGDNGRCNKRDGEACIDTALSAEGIIQNGICVATIGEECLAGSQTGTVTMENDARVCKMNAAQPATGQNCIDSATRAKGFIDENGKCMPQEEALCFVEGKEGVIQNGTCTAGKASSPAAHSTTTTKSTTSGAHAAPSKSRTAATRSKARSASTRSNRP